MGIFLIVGRCALLKSGEISEQSMQKGIMQWVRLQPNINKLVLHFANEGKRSARYGKVLKDMGLRPGVSDLYIAMMRHGYGGAWIELKSTKGALRASQEEFLHDMKKQGYFTFVSRSIDETIKLIEWYCFK